MMASALRAQGVNSDYGVTLTKTFGVWLFAHSGRVSAAGVAVFALGATPTAAALLASASANSADCHLWKSSFAIIALGSALSGFAAYLANLKLWTKVAVVTFWLASTYAMLRHALPRFSARDFRQ